jgi:hypothetical protein
MTENSPDHIRENTSSTTNSIWRIAPYGEKAPYDDIVRQDPDLADKLERKHDYKVEFEGYKYYVKFYDGGRVIVFRQKSFYIPSSQNNRYNMDDSSRSSNQFTKQYSDNKGSSSTEIDNSSSNHAKKIKDIKLVKPDEFTLEDGWEIHSGRPIVVIREQPFVTLVKWEFDKHF